MMLSVPLRGSEHSWLPLPAAFSLLTVLLRLSVLLRHSLVRSQVVITNPSKEGWLEKQSECSELSTTWPAAADVAVVAAVCPVLSQLFAHCLPCLVLSAPACSHVRVHSLRRSSFEALEEALVCVAGQYIVQFQEGETV